MIALDEFDKKSGQRVACVCSCGTRFSTAIYRLVKGKTLSCGCLRVDKVKEVFTKHGLTNTPTHIVWMSMRGRCFNPKNRAFPSYGGRGISVCERWMVFENFLLDMGKRPPGMSLDRIDNDSGYCPGNCRWTDRKTQARNRRSNRVITFNGTSATLAYWADKTGINQTTIRKRIRGGWPLSQALTIKPSPLSRAARFGLPCED